MRTETDPFTWINRALTPTSCSTAEFIYEDMDSQSGRALPILYQPFDATQENHWRDRGGILDYLLATQATGRRVLDFGPGDGWPSLLVAPFVEEVVGVDAAQRRVDVCAANASRLGLANTRFLHVPPGDPLPFPDGAFDAVMAATSVEQSPDAKATLAEIWRVLRPGGRLRMSYEALGFYRGGRERDVWLWPISAHRCRLILFDRNLEQERVVQVGLTVALSTEEVKARLGCPEGDLTWNDIHVEGLAELLPDVLDARHATTVHASGRTLVSWLQEVGFRQVTPAHNGIQVAGALFRQIPAAQRPRDLMGVDAYLRPIVAVAVQMAAPVEMDPMITAVK